jgi:hypothetical protein
LLTGLKANENHPLADLDPSKRNEQREQLIASILARLAGGRSTAKTRLDTITEEPQSASHFHKAPEAESTPCEPEPRK